MDLYKWNKNELSGLLSLTLLSSYHFNGQCTNNYMIAVICILTISYVYVLRSQENGHLMVNFKCQK